MYEDVQVYLGKQECSDIAGGHTDSYIPYGEKLGNT